MLQTRRNFLANTALGMAAAHLKGAANVKPPNIVMIFLDDSGWADFHPFGDPAYRTPNVERLAGQGCAFHNFYVTQAVCSASRSSLLSGCYPGRTQVFGAIGPRARGLDPKFATMGEVFKARGYRTAVFGKWHIGDQPETRPPARGYDESCGLMYSNDMWEFHPTAGDNYRKYPLQFWDNGKVTIDRVTKEHEAMLTTWYTEHAVDFIGRNTDNPFLLYVPHSMPHVPIFASEKFKGKSGTGLYGDVMMEIDWSVGEIMKALTRAGLDDNTLVFFSSDNGPWIVYGNHAGKTPFREAKATGFDGGTRSACIMRYPGKIKAGTISKRAFCTVDMLPTFASSRGRQIARQSHRRPQRVGPHHGPARREKSARLLSLLHGQIFEGVLSGDGHWKLHLPHNYQSLDYPGKDGVPGKYKTKRIELSLFDMENDPYETTNVIERHPDVAARLHAFAELHRHEFYPDQPE